MSNNIDAKHLSENYASKKNNPKYHLHCATLNVCGLKHRLNYPEFCQKIQEYDIFCVTETKTTKYDIISLQGYIFHSQCRKQKFVRKSGGIGAFIKNDIAPYITLIESESDYILWLRISKLLLKTDEDVVLGIVYLPPSDSRFNTPDEIDLFEVEVSNMNILHKYVLLTGDFNARTHTKADFISEDEFLTEHFEFDNNLRQLYNTSQILRELNFSEIRTSKDKTSNNEGNSLLQICKTNDLLILNGRCGKDANIGALTFKNTSVIDYSIASAQALKFVENFEIFEMDSLYTDHHALLETTLKFGSPIKVYKKQENPTSIKSPKWQENKKDNFVLNLDADQINALKLKLRNACDNSEDVTKENINEMCSQITDIFIESAHKSFPNTKTNSNTFQNKQHKRWFGPRCQAARRKYHIARKVHSLNPSHTNKVNLKNASKSYKSVMNIFINKFKSDTQEKLRKQKSKNPKEFWKIINNIERKEDSGCENISLETLHNFFKDLNESGHSDNDPDEINIDTSDNDEILNSSITEAEISKCIKSLKNNKCPANDKIINEYLKNSADKMMPLYIAFFNLVLDTGIIPDAWLEGIIRPIFKHSGDPKQPENYRPITILSCFGKLFTAVLNSRLTNFLNFHNILEENQAGFRAGHSTVDHIFSLFGLSEILKRKKKKLFCAFVDFSKAFDSVWRVGLWMKLLSNEINGKLFRIIYNLYHNIKSCVMFSKQQSNFFPSFRGVRQGENLSPVLFCIFLNDLQNFMLNHNCTGVDLQMPENETDTFLQLLVLLYADDTVIFGTDEESFQHNLDVFLEYSETWKLNINFKKTKILIFGIRSTHRFEFKLGNNKIEICDEFKYLGVIFTKTRTFAKAIKHNVDHANKALHLLYKKIHNLHIPIDLQLQLFDHTIVPILLYGCEVWGFQNTKLIETVHTKFLRNITKLRKSTPLYMLYAELGRAPLEPARPYKPKCHHKPACDKNQNSENTL